MCLALVAGFDGMFWEGESVVAVCKGMVPGGMGTLWLLASSCLLVMLGLVTAAEEVAEEGDGLLSGRAGLVVLLLRILVFVTVEAPKVVLGDDRLTSGAVAPEMAGEVFSESEHFSASSMQRPYL